MRSRDARVRRAVAALAALTEEERSAVFLKAGLCQCALLRATAREHPIGALGAAFGAIAGPPILRALVRLIPPSTTSPEGKK